MRKLAAAVAALALLFAGAWLERYRRAPVEADPGGFVGKAEAMIRRWSADKVGVNERTVAILAYGEPADQALLDPVGPAESSAGALLSGPVRAPAETAAFRAGLLKRPEVLAFAYDDAALKREEPAKAMAQAMIRLHEAGARIDLITEGRAVVPALK